MQRVVLDTNVLVSALWSPFGSPARVLDLVLGGQLQICFDSRIIAEYRTVLRRAKFNFEQRDVADVLDFLVSTGLSVIPQPVNVIMADEGDRPFYEVARHCRARLVTGNLKHYPDEDWVIPPARMLELLRLA